MKESPRRYTNPFLSDEENEKVNFWNSQELENSNTNNDLNDNCEDEKFRKSFEKETEFYTDKNIMECELPEFLVCYKENPFHVKDICVDEGIPHGDTILFDENNHEVLCISSPANEDNHDQFVKPEILKSPPVEDCYVESNLCSGRKENIDTDLPVVEPTNDHSIIGDNRDEVIERNLDVQLMNDERMISNESCGTHKVDTETEIPVQVLQSTVPEKDYEDFKKDTAKECETNEEVIDSVVPNELKNASKDLQSSIPEKDYEDCKKDTAKECESNEEVIDSVVPNELKNVSKDDNDNKDEDENELKLKLSEESDSVPKADEKCSEEQINLSDDLSDNASKEQDRPLPSLKSLLDSVKGVHDIDQQPSQSPVEEISISTIDENHTLDDKLAHVNPIQRGEGESSFSVAGPVSGLITYSGPIAFSGSVSIRSDSSTTSTRSFAFPILQNEWNSSPVRMAKADRRRLQKHRGWKHGLLCCRF